MKKKMSSQIFKLIKLLLICFIINTIFVIVIVAQPVKENIKLTTAEWREDLEFLAEGLQKKHKNAFHHTSRADFARAVTNLNRQIPELKDYEIVVGFQKLAAMIGDGHTFVVTSGIQRFYPFKFEWFGGELRVVRTTVEHQKALGARLIGINKVRLQEINRHLNRVIAQGENKYYVLNQSAMQIVRADLLAALKITANPDSADFVFQNGSGNAFSLKVNSLPPNSKLDWIDFIKNPPLRLQNPSKPFWFTYLPEKRAVYVNFRSYDNLKENAEKLLMFVDEKKAQFLIVDLSDNSGGNYNLVRQHLIYQIATRQATNHINRFFVITGRKTFSAAMTNAIDFRRETDALLIGEPPGARPNGYQENFWLRLPNSGLNVSVSMLYYEFMDSNVPMVNPDILVNQSWSAYKAGRDLVLEKIFSLL